MSMKWCRARSRGRVGLLAPPPPLWGCLGLKLRKGTKLSLRQFCLGLFRYRSVRSTTHPPTPPPPFKNSGSATVVLQVTSQRKTCCENLLFTEVMEHPPVFCRCRKPFRVSWTNVDIYGIKIIVFLMTCWHKQNTVININVYFIFCTIFSQELFEFMKTELARCKNGFPVTIREASQNNAGGNPFVFCLHQSTVSKH